MDYNQIVITIVTVLGSAGVLKFIENRLRARAKNRLLTHKQSDGSLYRIDLKARVSRLEDLLGDAAREKDDLMNVILELTGSLEALKVKVEFLTMANTKLKQEKINYSKRNQNNQN